MIIHFQYEVAILDICVVFRENCLHSVHHFFVIFIFTYTPSIIVKEVKIVTETQLEIIFSFIVSIVLNVIKFLVDWKFWEL